MGLKYTLESASRARRIILDYFIATATFPIATFVGAATITVVTPFSADSDFVLDAVNLVAYSAAGVLIVNPDYLIQIVDQGSGRNLQDNPIHVNNVSGEGRFPYILPEPKLFKGSGAIATTLTNLTAVAARVDIAYIGRKVFFMSGFNREALLANTF